MSDVEVKIDEAALKDVVQEAVMDGVFDMGLTYPCPECGKDIELTAKSNECSCGFTLNVDLGDLEIS